MLAPTVKQLTHYFSSDQVPISCRAPPVDAVCLLRCYAVCTLFANVLCTSRTHLLVDKYCVICSRKRQCNAPMMRAGVGSHHFRVGTSS